MLRRNSLLIPLSICKTTSGIRSETHCWGWGLCCFRHLTGSWLSSQSPPLWTANAKENHLNGITDIPRRCHYYHRSSRTLNMTQRSTLQVVHPPGLRPTFSRDWTVVTVVTMVPSGMTVRSTSTFLEGVGEERGSGKALWAPRGASIST